MSTIKYPGLPDLRFHGEYRRGYAEALSDVQRLNAASEEPAQQDSWPECLCGNICCRVCNPPPAEKQAAPEPECVTCQRCGFENWIQEGESPGQTTARMRKQAAPSGEDKP